MSPLANDIILRLKTILIRSAGAGLSYVSGDHFVNDEEFLRCHSEEQRDEESLKIMLARLGSQDFSLTAFARNDMTITYLFTTTFM